MQDDLLQCSCESPKGGHAGTNIIAPFLKGEYVLGDRGQSGLRRGIKFRNTGFEYH